MKNLRTVILLSGLFLTFYSVQAEEEKTSTAREIAEEIKAAKTPADIKPIIETIRDNILKIKKETQEKHKTLSEARKEAREARRDHHHLEALENRARIKRLELELKEERNKGKNEKSEKKKKAKKKKEKVTEDNVTEEPAETETTGKLKV